MKTYQTFSSKETMKLGEDLARGLAGSRTVLKKKGALVLALRGDLGAGKTTFVQGFLRGLGLKKRSPSPTFVIVRRQTLKHKKFSNIFHIDAYRLKKAADLETLGMKDVFGEEGNIVLVEWADRVKKILPKDALWLAFRHGRNEHERKLIFPKGFL